jgi:hypothetical protein
MFANWKTTIAGVGAILVAVGHCLVNVSNGDFSSIPVDFMGVSAGFGLIVAKDHNVTGGSAPNS